MALFSQVHTHASAQIRNDNTAYTHFLKLDFKNLLLGELWAAELESDIIVKLFCDENRKWQFFTMVSSMEILGAL